ncbi:bcl-2-modifying factor [Bombina bombina]|uniref:bcl-2-modifying factor n=1 Tax=Bombina bombina TaxID=8345 RepID=UPI00235AD9F5|nr:bcl-2-modifying factor [Bombina bombina]
MQLTATGRRTELCRPDEMEQDSFPDSDELDDDVFYPDDFGFRDQQLTSPSMFTYSQSYTCLLGRFQLFPLSHCCGPGCRTMECKDKATQTLGPTCLSRDIMLPCGITESPQRLFYGQAGHLLHLAEDFPPPLGEDARHMRTEQSVEHRIARKLQCIGDQFYRLHMQRLQQNRNQGWSQILLFFRNLIVH